MSCPGHVVSSLSCGGNVLLKIHSGLVRKAESTQEHLPSHRRDCLSQLSRRIGRHTCVPASAGEDSPTASVSIAMVSFAEIAYTIFLYQQSTCFRLLLTSHSLFFVSYRWSWGHRFIGPTFISAPNSPVPISLPNKKTQIFAKLFVRWNGCSGFAARIGEDGCPSLWRHARVNWLITGISPSAVRMDLFITPFRHRKCT